MSELIKGITFAEEEVTPLDDRIWYDSLLRSINLDYASANAAVLDNGDNFNPINQNTSVLVQTGFGIVYGSLLKNTAPTVVPVVLPGGTEYGYITITVDETQPDNQQVFLEAIQAPGNYPVLTKQDIRNGGSKFQWELAKYTVTSTGITALEKIENTIVPHNIYEDFFTKQEANNQYIIKASDNNIPENATYSFSPDTGLSFNNAGIVFKNKAFSGSASESNRLIKKSELDSVTERVKGARKRIKINSGYTEPGNTLFFTQSVYNFSELQFECSGSNRFTIFYYTVISPVTTVRAISNANATESYDSTEKITMLSGKLASSGLSMFLATCRAQDVGDMGITAVYGLTF